MDLLTPRLPSVHIQQLRSSSGLPSIASGSTLGRVAKSLVSPRTPVSQGCYSLLPFLTLQLVILPMFHNAVLPGVTLQLTVAIPMSNATKL